MAFAATKEHSLPLSEINTTPLIDVMLVLLIMLIFTIPIGTHSLDVDLPQPGKGPEPSAVMNKVVVTGDDRVLWNGTAVDQAGLSASLAAAKALKPEPELQFEPEAQASYNLSARTLRTIKASGATKFGFVGNDRYGSFGKAP